MILSRTNQPKYRSIITKEEDLVDDPLFIFEQQTLFNHEIDINTLKKTLFKYKRDDRYRNSPRYLRLWLMFIILYLKNNTRPCYILPILCCLIDNHIGDKLATLYEAIAYYQVQLNKLNEAEKTLLLGIKQRAEPTKRLERVLNQFYVNKTIEFNINQYTFEQYYNSQYIINDNKCLHLNNNGSINDQLGWIDIQLQHSIRASLLRESQYYQQIEQGELSFEELRIRHHKQRHTDINTTSKDPLFNQIKRDLNDIHNAVKRRKVTNHVVVIENTIQPTLSTFNKVPTSPVPSTSDKVPTSPVSSPSPLPAPSPLQQQQPKEQVVVQEQQIIPTNPDQEILHVTQLPHNSGFIQSQLSSHGILERDDYHIYKKSAQDIQKKLLYLTCNTNKRLIIQLGNKEYRVVKKLGEGGMAHIYLVQSSSTYYGLKVQQPPHPWEFYIVSQLHERRKKQSQAYYLHVLPCYGFHQYMDTSFLLMPYIREGTLLDALNLYRENQQLQAMPEPIVLLFTLQLLKEITALHNLHITHNDLKLDNIMLTRSYGRKGKLKLPTAFMVDYGRSIDLSVFKEYPTVVCKANWPLANPQSDYPLLNESYHPIYADYWQLATMVHLLLFGSVMRYSLQKKKNVYTIGQTIKRYWHKPLWTKFFHLMLNPQQKDNITTAIQDLIHDFEQFENDVPSNLIATFHNLLDTGK